MKLGDFLKNPDTHIYSNVDPVSFKVIGRDKDGARFTAEARAVMSYVSEDDRAECLRAARKELEQHYPSGVYPEEELENEQTYQVLSKAMRDENDPRQPFAETVQALRAALAQRVARELYHSFIIFIDQEFPPVIGKDQFDEIKAEAKKKSLSALLKRFGYSTIARALPGLASLSDSSPTPTSGAGEPA